MKLSQEGPIPVSFFLNSHHLPSSFLLQNWEVGRKGKVSKDAPQEDPIEILDSGLAFFV